MTGPEIVCAIGAAFLLLAICATVFAVIKGNAAIRDDDSGRSWKGFKSEFQELSPPWQLVAVWRYQSLAVAPVSADQKKAAQ